jgi:RHS repeat-associated protein
VAYSYDYAGRMQTMTNWSNYSGNSGTRVTTWNYDANRGFLTGKTYADGHGPSYTYTPAGRLAMRAWVRLAGGQPLTTTYNHNIAGDLTNVSYSDGVTPAVTNTYDRLGRLSTVACNGITDTLTYNLANQLLGESYLGGILNGLSVTNGYDADLRRTALVALSSGSQLLSATYGYDTASRLSTVSDGNNNSATYSYLANSPLVSQITFAQSGTTRMTTTKRYDYLNRLTAISSAPSASSAVSFSYGYNNANQRARDTLADGSYWLYQYDSLGQVIGANKYWSDETPVAGQQFDYTFDTIGNRTQTQSGGDQKGGYLRVANYTNNSLNQITGRDVPGYVDVKGVSFATNTVTVNSQTAYRKVEYFRNELAVNNNSIALWTNIITTATGQTSVTGSVYVAQEPEMFNYDADGNLTNDGRWAYTWDGENRLVKMTVNTNVGPQYQLTFVYDSQGRRIQKLVSTNGVAISTNRFLYDGWNLIAVLNPSSSLVDSFMWGSDLSGSQQGAGGVGGLLEVSCYGSSTTNCFPAFDGNGNVAALINAVDGTVAANYEYGPFGKLIRSTGPMAKTNPFRFSTKYDDDEADLLYYGYRYYCTDAGQWLSRDPIEENGGLNLYNIVDNNPISNIDGDGRLHLYGTEWTTSKFTCGQYSEWWNVILDKQTPKFAYIVQQVNVTAEWFSCSLFGYGHHYAQIVFWEIGTTNYSPGLPNGVLPAGTPAGSSVQDDWHSYHAFDHSDGMMLIQGIARFYYVTTTGILNWGPVKAPSPWYGNETTEGTTTVPTFWKLPSDNGEAQARHTTIVRWNCCCGAQKSSVQSNPPTHEPFTD